MRSAKLLTSCMFALLALAFTSNANALVITTSPTSFGSDAVNVQVTIDDSIGNGNLKFTIAVSPTMANPNIADLRGAFFHIGDESLIPGLSFTNTMNINATDKGANAISRVGGGDNKINGSGQICPCDFGVEIGTMGLGSDDFQVAMFVLNHDTINLDINLFSGQRFGVRATSTGLPGSARKGSSKLSGPFTPPSTPPTQTTPEPGTLFLMGSGLAGLGLWRWKSKK